MNKNIIVYSKPDCIQCKMTKEFLSNNNVEFEEKNILDKDNVDKLNYFKSSGFSSMPIVTVDGEVISAGFMPDKFGSLI